jgi:uroporphyrinogen decarboxylase
MNHIERVYTAIQHKEPDKVPKGEIGQGVDEKLVKELLGKGYDTSKAEEAKFQNKKKVLELLHMDLVSIRLDYIGPPSTEEIGVDKEGHKIYRDKLLGWEYISLGYGSAVNIKPVISNPKEVYDFQWPSTEPYSTKTIKRWKKETDYFIFPAVGGAFSASYRLNNFEDFMLWCYTNKEEVKEWTRKMTEHRTALAQKMVEGGAHAIVITDDLAFNTGTFIAPELLRELIFPYLEEEVYQIKKLGVPVFLHSDGDIRKVLPDIISIGFDGWQAIQSSPGCDYIEYIKEIKQKYGDRLCLMGNIEIDLLGKGRPEEIREVVRKTIEVSALGGGFILSSSNELGRETPPENALAMYKTAEECAKYKE